MLLRKRLPLWINVSLFAVLVGMIPLVGQVGRRPVSVPGTPTELAALLSRDMPALHMVTQLPSKPDGSIWICTRPQSREELWGLGRVAERAQAGQWQGIVFCERAGHSWVLEEEDVFIRTNWGKYGMRIGSFVLFGDPDLLQRIREVMLDYES